MTYSHKPHTVGYIHTYTNYTYVCMKADHVEVYIIP